MLNRRTLLILFLFFLTLFYSCHRKTTLTKNTPLDEISRDESYELVNPEEPAKLPLLDSTLYIGAFEDKKMVVRVRHSSHELLEGTYYLLDSVNLYLDPIPFSVETRGNMYCFRSGDEIVDFKMKYQRNAKELNGVVAKERKRGSKILPQLQYFGFQIYKAPKKITVKSDRYQKPRFQVDCDQGVVYGHAVGPWTSLYIPDEKGYAQALLPYVFKASTQKDLSLTMDIYTPRGDSVARRPLVVLIHGGAFFFGDKHDNEMVAQCKHLASLGYVAVSINYRMGFELTKASIQRCAFKAIQDAHAAMRYLSYFADQYRIDKNRMYIGGSSAGSITAMSMVYMTDETRPKATMKKHFEGKFGSLKTSGNTYNGEVKIKGIINMWGALYEIDDVKANPIPIISFHGTADQVVPCFKDYPFSQLNGKNGKRKISGMLFDEMYGSNEIHNVLKNKQVHQEFYPLEGMGHAPWKGSDRQLNQVFYYIQEKVTSFLYEDLIYDVKIKNEGQTMFRVTSSEVKQSSWTIKGGIALSYSNDAIDVRFFRDEKTHKVSVTGLLNNDAEFSLSKLVN